MENIKKLTKKELIETISKGCLNASNALKNFVESALEEAVKETKEDFDNEKEILKVLLGKVVDASVQAYAFALTEEFAMLFGKKELEENQTLN